ncbi:RNA polymerase subunit sigma [Fictibacillus phosphorivorans]|uniref:RNA polymerase subunit sigma n=1 Tax=Fictibacillus phosphorivorans TaxID=1221500 RepID=A0A163SHK7_9BACL|nr:sigma-70 family RNA polymerase sigma factor [Fictibacillus phosphorivorans]KZE69108.1 RNA polymerase subunit sigma [Fictibacillus phosphorivorans]
MVNIEEVTNRIPPKQNREELLMWLMKEYGRSLVRLAFTYVKQEQLAEDIVQDVFVKCFKHLDTFREDSSYKTWLYKITINGCKDVLKSWNFKNIIISNFAGFQIHSSNEKSPEEKFLDYEENNRISTMVVSLPVKMREVIIFYYYEDMTIEQIADLLNANQNTVKSRLQRGKQQLRKKLERGEARGR